uniref:Uncharacterized protein n=1 Tax=Rhizophora mucronata TaxID=61149 RepID=A0A2P2NKP5_RHIMU
MFSVIYAELLKTCVHLCKLTDNNFKIFFNKNSVALLMLALSVLWKPTLGW